MKDIILAGISASGKWTQSQRLLEYFWDKMKYFETWWVLRALQSNDNAIWNHLRDIIANGLLVKDGIVSGLFWVFLETLWDDDIVLADGCMRKIWQSKEIVRLLEQKNRKFVVIELVIPEEEVYTRLSNRRMCKSCGANFNVSLHGELDKCLKCGGEIYRRNDDVDQNAIKNRIDAYHTDIAPALEMLDKMWYLVKVDAMLSADEIFQKILEIIDK